MRGFIVREVWPQVQSHLNRFATCSSSFLFWNDLLGSYYSGVDSVVGEKLRGGEKFELCEELLKGENKF